MRVPAALHGRYQDCDARVRRAVGRIGKGAGLHDALADGWADPARDAGLLVIDGPSPLLGGEPHFHVYLPMAAIVRAIAGKRFPRERMEAVLTDALAAPWSVLGLCGMAGQLWTSQPDPQRRFLAALASCWGELGGLGRRYTAGSREPDELWRVGHNARRVLVERGITDAELAAAPSAERLAALLARTR